MTNYDLIRYAKELNIPNFRGVFMRDALPKKTRRYESAIVNLDSKYGEGTHWVCYRKRGNRVEYFDSFGNLRPPMELLQYLGSGVTINYNYERKQGFDTVVCGHLCLKFLTNVLS